MFYLYFIFLSLLPTLSLVVGFRDHHGKDPDSPGFAQGDHGISREMGIFPALSYFYFSFFSFLSFLSFFPPSPYPVISIHESPFPPTRTIKSGISRSKAYCPGGVFRRFERSYTPTLDGERTSELTQIIRRDHATTLITVFRLIN